MITSLMMDETKGLKDKARVAKNSSSRAYAGHSADMRHIFNIANLNLTEYARAFGIYKVVHNTMPKFSHGSSKQKSTTLGKRPRDNKAKEGAPKEAETATDQSDSKLFTKRLQKSKLKELSKNLGDAIRSG